MTTWCGYDIKLVFKILFVNCKHCAHGMVYVTSDLGWGKKDSLLAFWLYHLIDSYIWGALTKAGGTGHWSELVCWHLMKAYEILFPTPFNLFICQ